MDCQWAEERLAAYVLGALDNEERVTLERHLAVCPDCRRQVAAYAEVVDALPGALAVASPLRVPPGLKPRLLHSLEELPADVSGLVENGTAHISHASLPAANSPTAPRQARTWPRWPSRVSLRTAVTIGMLIALLVALGWGVHLSLALDHERTLQAKFADLSSQQQAVIFDVVGSTKTAQVLLRPAMPESTCYGKLYTRPDLPDVVAMAGRMPNPPAGQTYHLWLTTQGRTVLAGTMTVKNGFGMIIYKADRNGPIYDTAEVTLQSPGGSAPGGEVVLRWSAAS